MFERNTTFFKITAIEDDPGDRFAYEIILKSIGIEVTTAEKGQEGINKVIEMHNKGTPPNIVFTDLHLPGMIDGADVTREIKKVDPFIPIYLITASELYYELPFIRANLNGAKLDGAFQKPITLEKLAPIIKYHGYQVPKIRN